MGTRSGLKTTVMCTVLLLAIELGACVPGITEQHIEISRPSTTERPVKTISKREPEPMIKTEVSGNLVNVTVEQPTECRETLRSPMDHETGIERSLQNGTLAQVINVGTAAALIAGGVAVYSSAGGSCTKTPELTAQNPNPASRPCTAEEANKEKQTSQARGIGITSLSVLPLGAFVWNIFRAKDDKKTAKTTEEKTSDWTACGARPLEGVHLTLKLAPSSVDNGESRLAAITDGMGRATFDLSSVRSSRDRAELLVTLPQGARTSDVSLRGTPMRDASDELASREAWAQIHREEIAADSVTLDQVEADLSLLERKRDPWGEVEVQLAGSLLGRLKELTSHRERGADPRVGQAGPRLQKLDPQIQNALLACGERKLKAAAVSMRTAWPLPSSCSTAQLRITPRLQC